MNPAPSSYSSAFKMYYFCFLRILNRTKFKINIEKMLKKGEGAG